MAAENYTIRRGSFNEAAASMPRKISNTDIEGSATVLWLQ